MGNGVSPLVLAGDLGGTKANLALFEVEGGRHRVVREATLPSAEHASVTALLRAFLCEGREPVASACLGIAGPVRSGRVSTPNLPWIVDAREVEAALGGARVTLINDLVATAMGLGELPEDAFTVLQEGRPDPEGNATLLAAGTGLGEAILVRRGAELFPSASEGGHASFSPTNDVEVELLRFLAAEFGPVSAERVASGPGLRNVYRFLVATGRERESPTVGERLRCEDPPAVIADEGLRGTDAACVRSLDLWARAYGSEAGNLALKALATAGVYLGGGIAPKILPKLREPGFLEAFRNKGRMRALLADVPVRVILEPKTALYGAARVGIFAV